VAVIHGIAVFFGVNHGIGIGNNINGIGQRVVVFYELILGYYSVVLGSEKVAAAQKHFVFNRFEQQGFIHKFQQDFFSVFG